MAEKWPDICKAKYSEVVLFLTVVHITIEIDGTSRLRKNAKIA